MSRFIKNLVGMCVAVYFAISAIWMGKNLNYWDKLNAIFDTDKQQEEKPEKKKRRWLHREKYTSYVPERDDYSA